MEGHDCCWCWLPVILPRQWRKQQPGPRSRERATQTAEEAQERGAAVDAVARASGAAAEARMQVQSSGRASGACEKSLCTLPAAAETRTETAGHDTHPGLLEWVRTCCSCCADCAHADEEIIVPAKRETRLPVFFDQPTSEDAGGKDHVESTQQDARSRSHEEAHPNFTGVWQLERTEQQSGFLKAISLPALLAAAAGRVGITYTMEHANDEMSTTIELNLPSWPRLPAAAPQRRSMQVKIGASETLMMDDAGREFLMLNPMWEGAKMVAGIQYLALPHKLTASRYMEEGHMVEHMHYPSKGLEMRRIFRKAA